MKLHRPVRFALWTTVVVGTLVLGHPFPGTWQNGTGAAIHFQPVAWPTGPATPALCGDSCGDWKPYTRFSRGLTDARVQDPSNGGTAPQNYVNVSSSCSDKQKPSIYYYLYRAVNPLNDVVMFRWRVEQPAHNYATGSNPGNYSSSDPWSSAQWTVLFNIDGSGYRSLAAHLNGSSGSPSEPIDMLAGIWSNSTNQSIDYSSDPNVHLLAHNPTAFIGPTNKLMNFHGSLSPNETWSNGAAETEWDYGTTRATVVTTSPCNEYFIDYQIPVAMLNATSFGGPSITRDTPISMLFCTANSLSNPFQKDCAINRQWTAASTAPAPFGDYLSFNKTEPYQQPIISSVTATAPTSCPGSYTLTAKVQDVLAVQSGVVVNSLKSVQFYYWYDRNGDGDATAADTGSAWTRITPAATLVTNTLNTFTASWNAASLPKGKYLVGVQAVDDATILDDGMTSTGVDNRTFSYFPGDTDNKVYIAGAWATGQQVLFPDHSPSQTPGSSENWYGNPSVTGLQVALVGTAINACGVAPTLTLAATPTTVAASGTVGFTMTVTNPGSNSSAITVSSVGTTLPTGFTYTTGTSSGTNGLPSTDPTTIVGQQLTWTLGSPITLNPGASATLSFSTTAASAAGSYSATSTSTTSFGNLTSSPASVTVDSARVSLSMTPSAYSIAADATTQLIYTLRYANDSNVVVTGASISNVLPAGVTYVSCSGGSSCSKPAGTVSWTLGTLGAGANGTVTLTITVPTSYATYSLANSATLSVTAPDLSTVTANASTTVAVTNVAGSGTPAFTLTKSASTAAVAPGGSVTYTLTYRNYGDASAASVVLTDTLPSGMSFSSCSDSCSNSSGTITWNIGAVAAGATSTRTVTVTAATPFTSANPSVNSASIAWTGGTPVTATVSVGVTGQACSTYYFSNATTNVGTAGTQKIAVSPPTAPVGGFVTVSAPAGSFIEAARFYQNPATSVDVPISGTISSTIFVDRANGNGVSVRGTVYDYNSGTGTTVSLGTATQAFSGSQTGAQSFNITASGTLQKAHRLLWIYEAQSGHPSQAKDVSFQYGGTVTNAVSGGTTNASTAGANFCVSPPANLTLTNQVSSASMIEGTTPTLTYTLNYSNTGSVSATTTNLIGRLPSSFTSCEYSTNGTTWATCSSPGGSPPSHTFSLGSVTAGTVGTVYVRGVAPAGTTGGTTLTSTSSISSDQTVSLDAVATTSVVSPGLPGGTPALTLSLAADRSTATPGSSVVYTVTVINTGTATASNVVVSNTVPGTAYYTYASCTGSCGVSGSLLTWPTITSLIPGASQSYTYTMNVGTSGLPSGVTNIADTVQASGNGGLSATSNSVSVAINGNPSLVLLNTATPSSGLVPGNTITYTLTLANSGAASATSVVVTNPIPTNTTYAGNITASQGTGSFDTVGNRVIFNVGTLASGATVTLNFDVTVNSPLPSGPTTITSTATADSSNAAQQITPATASASAAPVLTISKSAPTSVAYPSATLTAAASGTTLFVDRTDQFQVNQYVKVGAQIARIVSLGAKSIVVNSSITATSGTAVNGSLSFTIAYGNTGNADATSVTVREVLASGFGYYLSTPTAGSAPAAGGNGNVDWTIGTLPAGYSSTVEVVAFPVGTGSFTNNSSVSASNATTATTSSVTRIGGLSVVKSTSTPVVSASGTATYTIVISNSLGSAVNTVSLTDKLPAGFSYSAGSATVGGVSTAPTFAGADTGQTQPTWSGLTIPANGSLTIVFNAQVAALTGAGAYQNELEVTAPAGTGVSNFDPLLTTAEDVTVLAAASGVLKGYVFRRANGTALSFNPLTDTPLSGVRVEIHKTGADCTNPVGGNCVVVYTDSSGYFERTVAAEPWIVSVVENTGDLPTGWFQLAGTNDNTVSVPDQGVAWDYNGFTSTTTHTVTGTAGANGSIAPGSRTVVDGDTTTFTVTANSSFFIDTVTGCGGSLSGATYTTGVITANCTVNATFDSTPPVTHLVSTSAGAGGSIAPTSATVIDGNTTAFTITPNAGFAINTVSGCSGSLSGNTYTTGAITGACTVTASFTALSYTVNATAGTGGSIAPASATVTHGNTTSFTVTPNSGFAINSVSGCSGSLSGSTYTTGAITGTCTVTATFSAVVPVTYLVDAIAGAGGSVAPTSILVASGATTAFTLTPNAGYHIVSATGCGGSLSGSTYTTGAISGACTVNASFAIDTYTVNGVAGSGGSIGPSSATVNHGSTTAFTLTPDTGYHIVGATGCGGSLSGSTYTTGAITGACTVNATFAINTYTVNGVAGSGGSIGPSSATVNHGDTTAFTLTPDVGYHIVGATGCGGSLSGSTYTTGTITGACTVNATFAINTYTVNAVAGSGGSIGPSSATVNHGATTAFTLTPDIGYHIVGATGCGGSLSGSTYTTGAITGACTVNATFAIDTFTVNSVAGSGGAISPSSVTVNYGDTTAFTLTPNGGYGVSSVSGCGGSLSGLTYTTGPITGNCTVTASFVLGDYTVTAVAGSGGSIGPSSASVSHGNTTSFALTPDVGYHIVGATGCSGSLSGSTYTTGAVTGACTVTASFAINTYTVSSVAGSGGSIGPSSATVNHGNTTSFTLTPDAGYHIGGVTGCGGSLSGTTYTTAAITGDCTVSANFAPNAYTVTALAGSGGSIGPASASVNHGSTTTFSVTPSANYRVASVTGCGGSLSGTTYTTGTIMGACTVSASFTLNTYTVSTSAGSGGAINPGSAIVNGGETTSFVVTPARSFAIASVTGCGGTLTGTAYTTGVVTAACTVTATFTQNAPLFDPAPPASINARALFTDVPTNIKPRAIDGDGSPLTVTLVGPSKLRPGRHILTWSATDSQGRTMTTEQQLDIWPMVSVSEDLVVGFGNTGEFRVVLNGDAPVYPFDAAFTVSGDGGLGTLHTLAPATVRFASGTEEIVQFDALSQGTSMPVRHLTVVLDPALNIGERGSLNISLISENMAPQVQIVVTQANRIGTLLARDGGAVVLHAVVDDPNPLDRHTLQWTYPTGAQVQVSTNGLDLTLDPQSTAVGIHEFGVSVTDNGTPPLSGRNKVSLAVRASELPLGGGDQNGNGIPDSVDGWSDSGNGIPAYLNRTVPRNVLPEDVAVTDQYLVEGEPGIHLRIGTYSQLSTLGARLLSTNIASSEDVVDNVGGLFDVEAVELGLTAALVRVVIPQRQPIPDQPIYRLWDSQQNQWHTFVENGTNTLSSAPGEPGYCPPAGSSAYTPGLTPGHFCVQVRIEDGGANDTDKIRNAALSFSGGVGQRATSIVTGTSSGGGGSMGGFAVLLGVFAMVRRTMARRTRVRRILVRAFSWRIAVAFASMLFALSATAKEEEEGRDGKCFDERLHCYYLGGLVSLVRNSDGASDMDDRLRTQGFVTQTSLTGQTRFGGAVFGGYRWEHLAAELSYAYLGRMDTVVAGNTPVDQTYLRAISAAHPRSGEGPQASALYFHELNRQWEAYGRLGVFYWRNTLSAEGRGRFADIDGRQFDPFVGLGLQWHKPEKRWMLTAEFQPYRLDSELVMALNVGFKYRIGRKNEAKPKTAAIESTVEPNVSKPAPSPAPVPVVKAESVAPPIMAVEPPRPVSTPPLPSPPVKPALVFKVNFDFNSTVVKFGDGIVDSAADYLRSHPELRVAVTGHTDLLGNDEYNLRLSMRRAQAVADALVTRGVERSRIVVDARGRSQPLAGDLSEQSRASDRRVHIVPMK